MPLTFNLPKHTSPHQLTCGSNVWPLFVLCVVYYFTTKGKALWCLQGWGMWCSWHIFVPTWLSVCLQSFVTKLGIEVHHYDSYEPECHAKKWDSIFRFKVTVWAYIIKIWQFLLYMGAGIAQWLEHRTRDWKVAGLNPCWNGGRIFFSRVDFLCWLLFRYPFHPRVTTVARKKSRSFCQKCRWQVTAKHAYTLRMWILLNRASALVTTCP